uniref:Spatacsin C-terminal domain-containing protein n=1 Tax=Esox lucius TaxID=8010 RepID=A0A6Q2ZLW4_ESOLU
MIKMLHRSETRDNCALEVALIPEGNLSKNVVDAAKAKMAQGCTLLCYLSGTGEMIVGDISKSKAPGKTVKGKYTDFTWEEVTSHNGACGSSRLLAVTSECELTLYELEAEGPSSTTFVSASEFSLENLMQLVKEKDLGVSEVLSLRILSLVDARCFLLLNSSAVVQLRWIQGAEPEVLSCSSIALPPEVPLDQCANYQLCRGTLFVLTTAGVIYVFDSAEGKQLATVDLPSYHTACLGEDEPVPLLESFGFFHVSPDLCTVVAATQSNTALAVDLNHYFRMYPAHLLCRLVPSRPPFKPQEPWNQDSLLSSTYSHTVLGTSFSTDWSWEARLTSLYKKAKASPSSSPQTLGSPWFKDFPHFECTQAAAAAKTSKSSVPSGGLTMHFSVPNNAAPVLLSVSEFSTVVTFVCPGNGETAVAFWDLQSQTVTYHRPTSPSVPVQRTAEEQLCLFLKTSGLYLVLFAVSQEELLNRLMVFGSASTVDSLCHLNEWGRCSIPIHALQAGLKNHQLDTVDFFLKSKKNILSPPTGYTLSDQPAAVSTQSQLKSEDLIPSLDLLRCAIKETHIEAQSRQFSEQLLSITLAFLNTQVRVVLSATEELDENLRECVAILDRYISDLRTFMKRYPWQTGPDTSTPIPSPTPAPEELEYEDWKSLSMEEVVQRAVLTKQIPRAQAYLRSRSHPEQQLEALRSTGLRLAFSCLTRRDLEQATALLRNMVRQWLLSVHFHPSSHVRLYTLLCIWSFFARRVPQMAQTEPGSTSLLEELVGQRGSRSEQPLWSLLRLDWARQWDHNTQKVIVLSRLQDSAVSSSDPGVLWSYLTSLHDEQRVTKWIETLATQNGDPSSTTQWPTLAANVVNNNTHCSAHMRDHILHMLARRGLFTQAEIADFEQLLWRLGQAGGVMQANPPVPHYRSPQGHDFHTRFIHHCLDNSLHYLLYTYLEHYRLTPRNCLALADKSLYESQPWFEMMVKIQEITRDLSDPNRVFQASLTSAQVLIQGSQATVSSMLLEGHSLLALATIMFAPGGIDQVVSPEERAGSSVSKVDLQLLKMALSPYPKLKAALFPVSGLRGTPATTSDVSVYHLMQVPRPYSPAYPALFAKCLSCMPNGSQMELPHFSSPQLVGKYALIENLNFLYYLRHGRPSFAYGTFLVQHLIHSVLIQPVSLAAEQAYSLAMMHFSVPSVAAACVCFCELLGVCSLKLRVDIKVLNLILRHWSQGPGVTGTFSLKQSLAAKGSKLVEVEREAEEELLVYLETAVKDGVEKKGIGRSSFEAGQEWALPVQFCQQHALPLSSVYPLDCAADGQWLHFLLFVQLHSYPPQQVRTLVAQFNRALQAHLTLAFHDLQFSSPWSSGEVEDQQAQGQITVSSEEVPDPPRELFQVLLQSQEQASPWRYLLGKALGQHCPMLTILAACHQDADLLQCLCVWVLTSVNEVISTEATTHLDESLQHQKWNLHDLSVIWKTMLKKCRIRPLIRGFQLFQRDSPLIHVLLMYELCYDYKNYPEAKKKLIEFQKCLINVSSFASLVKAPAGIPLQWVECQASVLLLTMMQQCATPYELRQLLQLLADMERLLKSNGPDFKKLSLLSKVLQDTSVSLPPRLLENYSPDVLRSECQSMLEQLQARGLFPPARQVAELAGLPIDGLVISELLQDLSALKAKRQWERRETRVSFWRKCHEQFRASSTDPEASSEFFMAQAVVAEPPRGSVAETEMLCVQERCLLLSLAGYWLSRLDPVPLPRLEDLEKQLWTTCVRQQVLLTAMEKESMFALPASTMAPEENSYEALVREFSFSKMVILNEPRYLSLDGLPSSSSEGEKTKSEEQGALATLVGQLLDEGCIHEASRVCRYFSFYHRDMWVVLRCRSLASGELQAGLQDRITSDIKPKKTASFSSLSSFVVVPSPEDQTVTQLQMLVDESRHGKSYCKQVLSLYELSKELQCSYSEISAEEPQAVLCKVLLSQQPERYKKALAFISVQGLQPDTVAQLVSTAVLQGLLLSTQEKLIFSPDDGKESFLQLAKLCGDPNLVGIKLLDQIPTVPLGELRCTVELLILAHDCFSLTCNMEGIVRVLQAARHLSHAHLAHSDHYSLLVRLLTGIGRYTDMTYIFDLLNQNHRFEMLLRKKVESNSRLKTALLDYIKRCLPADSEKYNMVALCFSMCREIGENLEGAARAQLKLIESQPWGELVGWVGISLIKVLTLLKDAAESYSKDSCVRQAARCVKLAKLVTLQLYFLNHEQDQRVINLHQSDLIGVIVALPRCYQAFVLSEAYDYSPDWAEVLYQKVILSGDFAYLDEFRLHRTLPASLFEEISIKLTHNTPPSSAGQNLKRLLQHCEDVYTYYKLAYEHKFFDVANMLLQDSKTSSYLNDRLGTR